jgi:ABC-type phosphate transport system ATPase subunit
MNRGTKITVFIASMALTVGSLLAFVGPRHCGHHGMYRHYDKMNDNNYHHGNCTNWNDRSVSDSVKVN